MEFSKRPFQDESTKNPSNEASPKKFVWLKKQKKDIEKGLTPKELERQEAERRLRNRLQIQKLERQRQERESQREAKQREKEEGQMEKEREALGDWEGKTRRFHLGQAKERALLRVREGRAEALDLVILGTVITADGEDGNVIPMIEGDLLEILEGLDGEERKQLALDVEEHSELEEDQDCLNYLHAVISFLYSKPVIVTETSGFKSVKSDVENLLKGKSVSQLCTLEASIQGKLSGQSGPVDVSYWEGLLGELKQWKRRGLLGETGKILEDRRKAAGLKCKVIVKEDANVDGGVEDEEIIDASLNWDPHPNSMQMYRAEAHRRVGKDEIPFNAEADDIPRSLPSWTSRFPSIQPVKPRFFNRVRMNYCWNRYNQTHYDAENPPPKTVQGYRFNIFYPGLTESPTYRVEADPASADMRIIRFSGGPPYEDLVFRISDEEWDMSYRAGFKCTFESQTLRLHVWFKSERYRR